MVAAQASAEAIRLIAEAVKENNSSATFLLGDRYIQALQRMGESENSKIVALPGDIVSAIRAIVGGKS